MGNLSWIELSMTSNTTPSPYVASASSILNSNHQAYKAFNGTNINYMDCWVTGENSTTGWIQIDYGEKKRMTKLKLTSCLNALVYPITTAPKTIKILGSNDNSDFVEIKTISDLVDWSVNQTKEFSIENNTSYRYYRLQVIENNGDATKTVIANIVFGELVPEKPKMVLYNKNKYYSISDNTLIHLPDTSDKNMILYGIKQGTEIQLDVDFDKMKFIQDKSEVLGNGKVFRQPIDSSKTSIKNISTI